MNTKTFLLEYVTRAQSKLNPAKSLSNVRQAMEELANLEKHIKDDSTIIGNAHNPVWFNGRWVGVTEPIKPIDTFSDEDLIAEIKKRMGMDRNCHAPRA
jgi:hypothetical protein